jgi:predicted TIM-barrel fold metal-dependent hydrolase
MRKEGKPMIVIDVNTAFGRRSEYDYDLSLQTLLAELDGHRIAAALSYSLKGVHYDPRTGNRESIAAGRAYPHLIPVATLDLREYLGWEDELAACLQQGVRVFRFFPQVQGWSVASRFFQRVLARLRGSGVALVFSTSEGGFAGWGAAEEIANVTAGTGLPVILTDTYYNNMAEVITLMQHWPHLHAETNWLATVGAVEIMAKEVGTHRLLFGSAAPLRPIQKALNEVLESALSAEDKAAILGGNAIRLLKIAPEALAGRPQLASLDPQGFAEPIIDVHSHLGYWRWPIRPERDPAQMLRRMRQFGITRSVLSSYEGMRYDMETANRDLAAAIEGHPELLGYVELNPHQLAASCAEMDRYFQLPNFVGVEVELIHTAHATASPEVRQLTAEIAKRGKPVLFMASSRDDAGVMRDLARANPSLPIILAHGIDVNWARVIADTPNLYAEFCASRPNNHDIRDSLALLGPERLLFGSDQTLLSVGAAVGLYCDAGLTAHERRLILGENARRIFRL